MFGSEEVTREGGPTMRHVVLSSGFTFSVEPFPAFRSSLVYGRNQRSTAFLPCNGVVPVVAYKVTCQGARMGEDRVLYEGSDKAAAERARSEFDSGEQAKGSSARAYIRVTPATLP